MNQTVQAVMMVGTARLREAGISGAAREAQMLMAHALGVGSDRIILLAHDTITSSQTIVFDDGVASRLSDVPMSHILGGRLFYGRWFSVTSDVLDPRPETEDLVAQALNEPFQTVLDLGVGSGCILLSLLAERPEATGIGADMSGQALEIAAQNAHSLGVADRASFQTSDWFAAVEGTFDLIVSNPPYIALDEMVGLQPEVREHEPRMALTDESDGLMCYRAIVADALQYLNDDGRLIVEIGPTQAAPVSAMMTAQGFAEIEVNQDIDGRDRVVSARKGAK